MSKPSIVGPNPLPAAHMSAEERLKELATILAAGVIRARYRAAAKLDREYTPTSGSRLKPPGPGAWSFSS